LPGGEGSKLNAFAGKRDRVQHSTGQRLVGLGIHPHGNDVARAGDRRGPVAVAVRSTGEGLLAGAVVRGWSAEAS
jgi:hypothetical protein